MDLELIEVATVPGIMVLCLLAGQAIKATRLDNKWIPTICGCLGLLLGLLGYYVSMPNFPAPDPVNAAAVGAMSGLAATGIHQLTKQLHK